MFTHTKWGSALVVLLAAGAISACGGAATTASKTAVSAGTVVTLKNIQFHPAVLHIMRGESVTWKWKDADIATQHNVTSIGRETFTSSPTMMAGSYTVKFVTAGTYSFECTIHPASMQGKIIVRQVHETRRRRMRRVRSERSQQRRSKPAT